MISEKRLLIVVTFTSEIHFPKLIQYNILIQKRLIMDVLQKDQKQKPGE